MREYFPVGGVIVYDQNTQVLEAFGLSERGDDAVGLLIEIRRKPECRSLSRLAVDADLPAH